MQSKITEIEPDVFFVETADSSTPRIEHNGIYLYRFMDSLYIKKENLEDLSPKEVSNLCRARLRYPDLIGPVNGKVKKIINMYVQAVRPSLLFEIGAGESPAVDNPPSETIYLKSDADSRLSEKKQEEMVLFSEENYRLPYDNCSLDMAVAVFVFQFKIYREQIEELYRCLKIDGVIVANVYRRRQDSRADLEKDFNYSGFYIVRLQDPQNLCREHEYWLIGKNKELIEDKARQLLKTIALLS